MRSGPPIILNGGIYGAPAVPGSSFAYLNKPPIFFEPWTEYRAGLLETVARPTWTPSNTNGSFANVNAGIVSYSEQGGATPTFYTAAQTYDASQLWQLNFNQVEFVSGPMTGGDLVLFAGFSIGVGAFLKLTLDFNQTGHANQINCTLQNGAATLASSLAPCIVGTPFQVQLGFDGINGYAKINGTRISGIPSTSYTAFDRRIAFNASGNVGAGSVFQWGSILFTGTPHP